MSQFRAYQNQDNASIADASRIQSNGATLLNKVVTCDGTTAAQALFAALGAGTGQYNNIVSICATVSDAAVDTWVTIKETGGGVLWSGFCQAKAGIAYNLANAPIRTVTAEAAITVETETPVSKMKIVVTGYVGY